MKFKDSNQTWGVIQHLEVQADTKPALEAALTIALIEHKRGVESWSETPEGDLLLYWHKVSESNSFLSPYEEPYKLAEAVSDWLQKKAKYPKNIPDTDGSVEKGFTVSCKDYGYVVCRVSPTWIIYGK